MKGRGRTAPERPKIGRSAVRPRLWPPPDQHGDRPGWSPDRLRRGRPEPPPAVGTTFEDFFAAAELDPNVSLITGSVCGVRVQEVEDPLMRHIRYLDKLVDELARSRPMEKVLRA